MRVRQGYGGLDRFRLIAAILVIAIHTSPLLSFWSDGDFFLTRVLARIAVPFFLMVTGQFVLGGFIEHPEQSVPWGFLRKNLILYGITILLYLPIGLYAGHYKGLITDFHLGSFLGELFRMLIFDGSFYHLWYFPACVTGVLLVCALSRIMKLRGLMLTSAVLYLFGLLGDSYYGLIQGVPVLSGIYECFFQIFSYTRNGIFLAPIFLVMGAWMGSFRKQSRWNVMSGRYIGLVLSLSLMTIEAFLLRQLKLPRHDSMYLFLPLVMLFLYPLLLEWGGKSSRIFRGIAAWIYILHPAMIVVVRGVAKATKLTALLVENSIVHFLIVTLLSVLAAFVSSVLISSGEYLQKRRKCSEQKEEKKQTVWQRRNHDGSFFCGRAWIELDRAALRQNVEFLRGRLPKNCELMPAVKAEAYGHGAALIAGELNTLGIRAFCVASAEEGVALRRAGVRGEILVLGYTHPRQFPLLVRFHLIQTVVDYAYARQLCRYGKKISVHIGVDTGMHRLGERSEHIDLISQMFEMKQLEIKGLFTHLCAGDTMEKREQEFTRGQVREFNQVLESLKELGIPCPKYHLQASYGVLNYPELGGDYARIGIALYGVLSNQKDTKEWQDCLYPVLSLKARVAAVKELAVGETAGYGMQFVAEKPTKLAVLTIGYADGLPRALGKGRGSVLIRGRRAPIVGLICMDQTLVDISGIAGVKAGDTAVLIGRSEEEEISAAEIAEQAGTITNEILSRLGGRLERIVV